MAVSRKKGEIYFNLAMIVYHTCPILTQMSNGHMTQMSIGHRPAWKKVGSRDPEEHLP